MSENACQRKFLFSVVAFALTCIVMSAAILAVMFSLFTSSTDCVSCRSYFKLLGIVAAALLATGLLILLLRPMMMCYKRRRRINTNPQVVVSLIPAEDLEKSAAPILHFVHVSHRLPFMETSSIDSLPDYFTAVQNPDEVYASVDTDVWIENVLAETPPPSYEEALEMTTSAA